MRARWWSYFGAVIVYAVAAGWAAVAGPDPFPTHFGLSGQPITSSPRGEAVLLHAAIAGGIAVLFAGLALVVPRIPAALVSTPRRDEWLSPALRPRFDEIASGFLLWIGGLMLLQRAATIVVTIIDVGETAAKATLLVLFLLAVVGSVGYLLWVLTHPPARSTTVRSRPHRGSTRSRR